MTVGSRDAPSVDGVDPVDSRTRTSPYTVVIGSSAGGLEAVTAVLESLPSDLPAACIIAQHLAPDHDSELVSLLARATPGSVRVAASGDDLAAGVVYVTPPGRDIVVDAGVISLVDPGPGPGPHPSIDRLMSSVALDGARAVGIILSGTGSDGSSGLREIREAGGLALAQSPQTARFDAMPRAAMASGAIDMVLAPSAIGPFLARVLTGSPLPAGLEAEEEAGEALVANATSQVEREAGRGGSPDSSPVTTFVPLDPESLRGVITALYNGTGIDFSEYKSGTLSRQVARRQALVSVPDLAVYRARLITDANECQALAGALQVTVTSFYRDPEVWATLGAIAAERWGRPRPEPLRVWVPGCATGEEAYTVAMTLATRLGIHEHLPLRLKVFATDLSDNSLETARRGRYSDAAVDAIPSELREAWLHRGTSDWEVVPALRESIVFARHNIAVDPPFPGLDLITLRNTLIYFTRPLQERVTRMCHFALRDGGLLVLGQSERPESGDRLFAPVDETHRIYVRTPGPQTDTALLPMHQPTIPPPTEGTALTADDHAVLRTGIIERFAPSGLIVDSRDAIVEVLGDVTPWCWIAPATPSSTVVALIREDLRPAARSLLAVSRDGGDADRDVTTEGMKTTLHAEPIGPAGRKLSLLTFTTSTADPVHGTVPAPSGSTPVAREDYDRLADTLSTTQLDLQAAIDDLIASNTAHRILNEELQASSEELQASNEEVQATNEEVRATNEQYSTLNAELEASSRELRVTNMELTNIAASLTSGMIVLDTDLCIRRYTPLAVRLFPMITTDLGTPLSAINTTVPVPALDDALRATLHTRESSIIEVADNDVDVSFHVALQPFLLDDETVAGVIVVVSDVSGVTDSIAEAQADILDAAFRLDYLGILVIDEAGRIERSSAAFAELAGYEPDSLVATPMNALIENYATPDDVDAPTTMWTQHGVANRTLIARDGTEHQVAVSLRPIPAAPGRGSRSLVAVHDLTRLREATGDLATQVRFDHQTGALTRAHFRDRVTEELARESRAAAGIAVIWIDLDGFKDINDRHGHRAGDAVLREVAARLAHAARAQDCVGRLGGDEFAMLVTGFTTVDGLEPVTERVLESLRAPIATPDGQVFITGSLGLAVGPGDGATADELLHSADTAMYSAKAAGRDTRVYFREVMNVTATAHAVDRVAFITAIREQRFVMHYQPILCLETGELEGLEALVRWERDGETVTAARFIDIAASTGNMRALGIIVLDLVAGDLSRLDEIPGLNGINVAINMSPPELEERALLTRLLSWQPNGGYERICIEVTEATLLAHEGRAMESLVLLRRLGASIAIDDFGSGFSNMAMLERLQPSILKLDRSLLVRSCERPQARAVLGAAVALGHALDARVVIEGIETSDETDLAVELGADLGQGFGLGLPMSIDDLTAWVAQPRAWPHGPQLSA